MKAFFKDTDKIIINSMDHSESLVGKQFLNSLKNKTVKIEQRNDINDDFDGLVITIIDTPVEQPVIENNVSEQTESTTDITTGE